MVNPQMVMYEEEFNQIQAVVDRLVREANAKVVFIVDKNGQLIAASGEVDNIDTTSLASLTAGNIAATGGIAKLLRPPTVEEQEGIRNAEWRSGRARDRQVQVAWGGLYAGTLVADDIRDLAREHLTRKIRPTAALIGNHDALGGGRSPDPHTSIVLSDALDATLKAMNGSGVFRSPNLR